MTPADSWPRLADALSEISVRLQNISDELRVGSAAPAPPTPPQSVPQPPYRPPYGAPVMRAPYAAPPPYAAAPPPAYRYPPPHVRPASGEHPAFPSHEGPPRDSLWERMSREGAGSRAVAWIGGAVTLAGVVLLLVLAVQRGYIGPVPRVLLGGALGVALVAIAMRLHRSPDGRTGALAVAATGSAVLYLDTIATAAYYHFVPAWAGLVLGLAVAAGGVLIAWRWDAEPLAVFVVVGCAASAPILTRDVTLLVGFLLVLQIAGSPAQLQRHWTSLAVVAAAPPTLAVMLDAGARLSRGTDAATIAALSVTTSLVQIVLATLLARRPASTEARIGVPLAMVLAAPVPTLIAALLLPRDEAVAVAGGLGAVLVAFGPLRRTLQVPPNFADAAIVAGSAALFEAVCVAFTGDVRAVALLAAAALLALVAERLGHGASLGAAAVFGAAGLAVALGEPVRAGYLAIAPTGRIALRAVVTAGTTGVTLAVAAFAVAWAAGRVVRTPDQASVRTRWTLAATVALYGASAAVVSIGLAISPDRHGFLIGQMLVTLSWTVGAFVLLLRHVHSAPLRVAGLALVAAALAKLVLFDLASLSGIPRVLAFLGAGLVLLAAGARYARLSAGTRP